MDYLLYLTKVEMRLQFGVLERVILQLKIDASRSKTKYCNSYNPFIVKEK